MSEHNNTFLSRVFGVIPHDIDEEDINLDDTNNGGLAHDDKTNLADIFNVDSPKTSGIPAYDSGLGSGRISGINAKRDLLVNSDSDSESVHETESSDDDSAHNLLRGIDKHKNSFLNPKVFTGESDSMLSDGVRDERLGNRLEDDPRLQGGLDDAVPETLFSNRKQPISKVAKISSNDHTDDFVKLNSGNFIANKNTQPLLPLFNVKNKDNSVNNERIRRQRLGILSPREKALWMWANVENLDIFLQDVYDYYLHNGFYCILIKKATDVLTLLFMVYFSTYLGFCIDYANLSGAKRLSEILYDHCYNTQVTGSAKFFLLLFYGFVGIRTLQFCLVDLRKLKEMRNFFRYLLLIDENELQTISWQLIIKKLIILRDTNSNGILISLDEKNDKNDLNSKNRLTAHDIANRIMRKENYLVALYNKDILNFQLNLPILSALTQPLSILTKTLEWNINLCIIGYVFNSQGQFKPMFLKEANRRHLSQELRKRFIICGVLAIVIAPFLATYFILLNFFRFFYEFRSNPHLIGNREFSPYAEWKFREFNELYHFFKKRLHYSMESSNDYLNQFPKEKYNLVLRFVSFVSGALVTVLVILTILDPDLSINFEITENKSVLFYIGILGSIWAMAHGSTSDDYQNKIFDPEYSLRNVAEFTHYLPPEWEGRYHSEEVKNEFAGLFQLKLVLIIKELLSILFVPFIFCFALPKCSDQIIDFFREFTVHIDGLGHVCSFAMFDVEKKLTNKRVVSFDDIHPKQTKQPKHMDDESSDNKMLKSYLYFVESYADNQKNDTAQQPGPSRSLYTKRRPHTLRGSLYDPADSFMARSRLNNTKMYTSIHNFVGDESYLINLKGNDIGVARAEEDNDKGVLGMLNQFYQNGGKNI